MKKYSDESEKNSTCPSNQSRSLEETLEVWIKGKRGDGNFFKVSLTLHILLLIKKKLSCNKYQLNEATLLGVFTLKYLIFIELFKFSKQVNVVIHIQWQAIISMTIDISSIKCFFFPWRKKIRYSASINSL